MVAPASESEMDHDQLKDHGYDSDEISSMEKEREFHVSSILNLTGALPAKVANIIIATPAHSGALIEILFDNKMKEVGKL